MVNRWWNMFSLGIKPYYYGEDISQAVLVRYINKDNNVAEAHYLFRVYRTQRQRVFHRRTFDWDIYSCHCISYGKTSRVNPFKYRVPAQHRGFTCFR